MGETGSVQDQTSPECKDESRLDGRQAPQHGIKELELAKHEIASVYSAAIIRHASLTASARGAASNTQGLLNACMADDIGAVLSLMEQMHTRSTVLVRFNDGLTPLIIACRYNAKDVVRWICKSDSTALECK
ncbi:hypothetical protein GGI12_003193, partial [Dipsacomyces acuminosporus]